MICELISALIIELPAHLCFKYSIFLINLMIYCQINLAIYADKMIYYALKAH